MMEHPRHPNERPAAACSGPAPSPPAERDPRLDAYLDEVCDHLVGIVPRARRDELRAELALHLDCLLDASVEVGVPPDAAVAQALKRFGKARRLARQLEREQRPALRPGPWWAVAGAVLGIYACVTLAAGAEWGQAAGGLLTLPYFAAGMLSGRLVPLRWSRTATHLLGCLAFVLVVRSAIISWFAFWQYMRAGGPRWSVHGVGLAIFTLGAMMGCASHLLASWLRGCMERRKARLTTR